MLQRVAVCCNGVPCRQRVVTVLSHAGRHTRGKHRLGRAHALTWMSTTFSADGSSSFALIVSCSGRSSGTVAASSSASRSTLSSVVSPPTDTIDGCRARREHQAGCLPGGADGVIAWMGA